MTNPENEMNSVPIGFKFEEEIPPTYHDELEKQCRSVFIPIGLMAILSWLPYIQLDNRLHSEIGYLYLFRLGLTAVGLITLSLFIFHPYFKKKAYPLIFIIITYLELSTAVIIGLVRADPVYMNGFSILLLILPLMPFRLLHSLALLISSLTTYSVFFVTSGLPYGETQKYVFINFLESAVISFIAIFVLDFIRKRSYQRSLLIQDRNKELERATIEMSHVNSLLEESSIQLTRINEELKNANEMKSSLLGIAAHDLRNPLQVIIGYTDFLKLKMQSDPTATEKLEMIERSSDKMLTLISALLQTAAIEKGQLRLNINPIQLDKLAETVVKSNQPYAMKKDQKIMFEARGNCQARGDYLLLQQVFDNLINNAVKFSPKGRSIWVTIVEEAPNVIFQVRDEGPGLSDEDKMKAFGRFQRLTPKPTGGEASTGLGLSIIRDFVVLHQGTVTLQSELGKGCTFIVQLPKTQVKLSNSDSNPLFSN